jgi:hypothetical protein
MPVIKLLYFKNESGKVMDFVSPPCKTHSNPECIDHKDVDHGMLERTRGSKTF